MTITAHETMKHASRVLLFASLVCSSFSFGMGHYDVAVVNTVCAIQMIIVYCLAGSSTRHDDHDEHYHAQ